MKTQKCHCRIVCVWERDIPPDISRAIPAVLTLVFLVLLEKALRPSTTPAKQLSTDSSMKARVASQKAVRHNKHISQASAHLLHCYKNRLTFNNHLLLVRTEMSKVAPSGFTWTWIYYMYFIRVYIYSLLLSLSISPPLSLSSHDCGFIFPDGWCWFCLFSTVLIVDMLRNQFLLWGWKQFIQL